MLSISYYKEAFQLQLQPYLEMLEFQYEKLPVADWKALVQRTLLNICNVPDQYLGKEIPSSAIVRNVVSEIMDQFVSRVEAKLEVSH